ncbi:MAG TPA: hypothetical protein VNZ25_10335 [Candidatus Angelobacter sp.]|nr:hypothetical protein [Candidatus Angelobacter sp.]
MSSPPKIHRSDWIWLAIILVFGVFARFRVAALGPNYDFDSYRIVADIMAQGNNVYASTARYNYGPVWFNLIHLFDLLAGRDPVTFRWLLISLLTAADIGICLVLFQKFGRLAATLFFLNPVSILITGYHNQFDNLAMLMGLCAVLLFGDDFDRPLGRRKYAGLLVLGLSLMTKHLFFMFPLWLAVKQRGLLQKGIVLTLPILIFLAGFLPYWNGSQGGIIRNVFEYKSSHGAFISFYDLLLPGFLKSLASPTGWWLIILGLFALICRGKNGLESLLVYTAVLVATSPAIADQYLAIPAAFVSVELNLFSIAYALSATLQVVAFTPGPALLSGRFNYDDIALIFLVLTLVWVLWRAAILQILQNCRQKIRAFKGIP